MTRSCLLALAATLACCGWQQARAQNDSIYLKKGGRLPGRITRMSATEVVLSVGGNEVTRTADEIERVTFADEPLGLRRGRDAAVRGRFEDGQNELAKVRPDELTRNEVKQELLYYRAFCAAQLALTGAGAGAGVDTSELKKEAGNLLQKFIVDNPNSFHYYDAIERFADLAYSFGTFDLARQYYEQLAKTPWPDRQLRGQVAAARSLQSQGVYPEALARYESALSNSLDSPAAIRQKQLARIGRAVCLAKTGESQQGVQALEKIIAENNPSDAQLFARAYNGLGECHVEADRPKDALLAYLHVDLLFFSDPDLHAEALYHLSRLWAQVNKSDRAFRARDALRKRYAGSVWAKKL